ncbi:hypothetical protein HDU79_007584 [Rhizoclosmatium sp. JEL0117]|nr:hypothetical protein HDU79_007584 [Rhizoclosmatium sp. JEL0117]
MHPVTLVSVLLFLTTTTLAQITPAACSNLQSFIGAWGFKTTNQTSVNDYWTNCGCKFVVTIPKESTVAATCFLSNASRWSIYSIAISNPPITLGSLPAFFTVDGTDGFIDFFSLSLTNNSLHGNALARGQWFPPRTGTVDVSYNPLLNPWPGLDSQGGLTYYSPTKIIQNGNPNICCPPLPPVPFPSNKTCIPACSTCTAIMDQTITPDVVNPTFNGDLTDLPAVPASTTAVDINTTTTAGSGAVLDNGNVGDQGGAGSSNTLSTGMIVLIVFGTVIGAGVVVFGVIAQFTRGRQKPVVILDEDWDADLDNVGGEDDRLQGVAVKAVGPPAMNVLPGVGVSGTGIALQRTVSGQSRASKASEDNSFVARRRADGEWVVSGHSNV